MRGRLEAWNRHGVAAVPAPFAGGETCTSPVPVPIAAGFSREPRVGLRRSIAEPGEPCGWVA